MDHARFCSAIEQLELNWGRDSQTPMKLIDNWFERVQHIPNEAVSFVVDHITDNRDGFPRNITKAFKDGWKQWKISNPDRIRREIINEPCDDCHGIGTLAFFRYDERLGKEYEIHIRCGACGNWRNHFAVTCKHIGMATKAELINAGHRLKERKFRASTAPGTSVRDLSAMVGDRIPF